MIQDACKYIQFERAAAESGKTSEQCQKTVGRVPILWTRWRLHVGKVNSIGDTLHSTRKSSVFGTWSRSSNGSRCPSIPRNIERPKQLSLVFGSSRYVGLLETVIIKLGKVLHKFWNMAKQANGYAAVSGEKYRWIWAQWFHTMAVIAGGERFVVPDLRWIASVTISRLQSPTVHN